MRASPADLPPLEIPRHVRPRKPSLRAEQLNLVVIDGAGVFSEHGPRRESLLALPGLLRDAPDSLVICTCHERVFRLLNDAYRDDPRWDWQLTTQQRTIPDLDPDFRVESTSITIIGWKGEGKKRGRWHHFLDPEHFAENADWPADLSLYDLGCDVRSFLAEHQLHPTARAGGIAAQLLRHPNIYEAPRRQVPTFINEQARRGLPGNHYQWVEGRPGTEYPEVWYMDQESAHHRAAHEIELPHADHLVAVGNYWTPDPDRDDPADLPWIYADELDDFLRWKPKGLLYARLRLEPRDESWLAYNGRDPAPKWLNRLIADRTCLAYVFTNELDLLAEYGVSIDYLIAGWVSTHGDDCIRFYAEWAMREAGRATGIRRLWLKPTLHAVYGMLAARTREVEFVRRRGRADPRTVFVDNTPIAGTSGGPRRFVPRTTNVIQRGMIEAETRRRSCELALSMRRRGVIVLSIYADGVLTLSESDRAPAGLADGKWAAKHRLTRVSYADETHFRSGEMVKWPGTQQARPTTTGQEARTV